MPNRLMFHSSDISAQVVTAFTNAHYTTIALTNDPNVFWNGLGTLDNGGFCFLFSHGDKNSPLLIDGQVGNDLTDAELAQLTNALANAHATFYCMSCHTGTPTGKLYVALTGGHGFNFIAPTGYAEAKFDGSLQIGTYVDKDFQKTAEWNGNLARMPRKGSKISVP